MVLRQEPVGVPEGELMNPRIFYTDLHSLFGKPFKAAHANGL
jgi:hypothetical protein